MVQLITKTPSKVGIVPLPQKRHNLRLRSLLKVTQFLTGRAGALLFIPVTNLAMTLVRSGLPQRVPVQGWAVAESCLALSQAMWDRVALGLKAALASFRTQCCSHRAQPMR